MEPTQLILPAVATFALGTALLVPLRDDRRGRRATLGGGAVPLRPQFGFRENDRAEHGALDVTIAPDVARESVEPFAANEPASMETQADDWTASPGPTSTAIDATPAIAAASTRETPFSRLVRFGVRVLGIGRSAERDTLDAEAASPEASESETHVERSFAAELASLLGVASAREGVRDDPPDVERTSAGDGARDAREPTDAVAASSWSTASPLTLASIATPTTAPAAPDMAERDIPAVAIVTRAAAPLERVVPITRLPLRPHGLAITWTRDLIDAEHDRTVAIDGNERRDILERLRHDPGDVAFETIERAYHEEEGLARVLALRILLVRHARAARAVFVDALHTGTDDERALAVDGLASGDARDALPAAFSDRVEAIAARAALEYVGFADRATYRAALSPYVDAARLDALLVLLAGIVE